MNTLINTPNTASARLDGNTVLNPEKTQRLYVEQVNLLAANLPVGLGATLVNAAILTLTQWEVISHLVLFSWLASMLLITAWRYVVVQAYRRSATRWTHPQRWDQWFTIGAALSGVAWGSAGVFLFPIDSVTHQVFVIFVLAGMTAGAVVTFSVLLKVAVVFIVPTLAPLTLRLFVQDLQIHYAMGTMSLLFMAMILFTARRMYLTTLNSLELRFDNSDLVAYLAAEKEAVESLNEELKREVQERQRAEEQVRAVVDNVLEGIITMDERGQLESMNPAAERIFGYKSEELLGQHFKVLVPEWDRGEYDDYIDNRVRLGKKGMIGFGLDINGQRKNGEVFPMELGLSQMRVVDRRLFVGIVRDITDRKKIDHMKNQFISTVSHELRTPLTSMLGSLSLLTEAVSAQLSERGRALLNIARNNSTRLVRLVSDILDMDNIQAGTLRLQFKPQELMPLIDQAVEQSRAHGVQRGVRFVLEQGSPGVMINADRERLIQVMDNLLSNAAKFSPPNGVVEISVSRHDSLVRVSITDHGPGIPKQFHDRIFQKFSQADPSDTPQQGGAGLGLSIAKAIIEKHDGNIGFKTQVKVGTCFYFELPEWRKSWVDEAAS